MQEPKFRMGLNRYISTQKSGIESNHAGSNTTSRLKVCNKSYQPLTSIGFDQISGPFHFRQPLIFNRFQPPFCGRNLASIPENIDSNKVSRFPSPLGIPKRGNQGTNHLRTDSNFLSSTRLSFFIITLLNHRVAATS